MKGSIITTNTSTSTFLVLRIHNRDKGVKDINELEFVSLSGLGYAHRRGRYHPQSRPPLLRHLLRHLHHQSRPTTHYQQRRRPFLLPPDQQRRRPYLLPPNQRRAAQDRTAPGHSTTPQSTRTLAASRLGLRIH